jgi:tight adherence protein C
MNGWVVFGIAIGTAIAFGVFVYLLFPSRARSAEAAATAPTGAEAATQRGSFAESLTASAPSGYIAWLDRQIRFAGRPNGWSVAGILVWKVVLLVVGVLLAFAMITATHAQPIFVILGALGVVLLFFLPDVMINSRAHDRQQAITLSLPDTLDQMTISVEAGLGFDSAMSKAARSGNGPLAEELVRVLQDMSIGRTRRESFRELEQRTNSEDLRRFVRAVIQADAHGVAIADVLRVQAAEMRTKRRQRAEEQAQKITVKIIFPLIFCLLPVMVIVILTPPVVGIIQTFSR